MSTFTLCDCITGTVMNNLLFLFTFVHSVILDSFLVDPSSTSVNEGESLQLFCIHSGSLPSADITWTLNGNAVVASSRVSVLSLSLSGSDPPQTSSSLYISPTESIDEGSYTCEARNQLLPDTMVTSGSAEVTVIGEGSVVHRSICTLSFLYATYTLPTFTSPPSPYNNAVCVPLPLSPSLHSSPHRCSTTSHYH